MKTTYKINDKDFHTDNREQHGMKIYGIEKKQNQGKWINKVEKFNWIIKFRFINQPTKGFNLEIDFFDEIVCVIEI